MAINVTPCTAYGNLVYVDPFFRFPISRRNFTLWSNGIGIVPYVIPFTYGTRVTNFMHGIVIGKNLESK